MDSHTEPVDTWGREPCESVELSTTSYVSGRGSRGAPRPSGTGRGIFEVQTSLINKLLSNGPRHQSEEKEENSYDEQKSSPAAAPSSSVKTAVAFQSNRLDGNLDCTVVVSQPRLSGDLENSRSEFGA